METAGKHFFLKAIAPPFEALADAADPVGPIRTTHGN